MAYHPEEIPVILIPQSSGLFSAGVDNVRPADPGAFYCISSCEAAELVVCSHT